MRRSTPGCAARSPTRRSTASSRACRSDSASTGSTRTARRGAGASCASASTRRSTGRCASSSTELERRELRAALWRDLEAFVREEAESELAARPAALRGLFGSERSAPGAAARARARRLHALAGRSTESTSIRSARAESSRTTSRARHAHSAAQIEQEKKLQIPLYMLVLRDLVGIEPLGGLYRAAVRRAEGAGPAPRRGAGRRHPRIRQERLPRRRGFLGPGRARRASSPSTSSTECARATSDTTRRAATARPGASSGRCAG